jgi:CubicO group peptidase (beta-lactamase class C family)
LNYFKAFGHQNLEENSPVASSETTVCLASATKLVTSVAVMQVVERGLVGLDDDITKFLPEWKDSMILKGCEEIDGQLRPILEKAKGIITLRWLSELETALLLHLLILKHR